MLLLLFFLAEAFQIAFDVFVAEAAVHFGVMLFMMLMFFLSLLQLL